MATLSLKISVIDMNVVKTMQFEPSTIVYDACRMIRDAVPAVANSNRKFLSIFILEKKNRKDLSDCWYSQVYENK